MKRFVTTILLLLTMVCLMAPVAFAAEAVAEGAASDAAMGYFSMAALACGLGIGLAALGTGIGQGIGLAKAAEGVARNPGASGKITTTLIIGLAIMPLLLL
jgi:F-type H+-transporting ATPase subunit c